MKLANQYIFKSGSSSFGRAIAFQAIGGEFEPRLPLIFLLCTADWLKVVIQEVEHPGQIRRAVKVPRLLDAVRQGCVTSVLGSTSIWLSWMFSFHVCSILSKRSCPSNE